MAKKRSPIKLTSESIFFTSLLSLAAYFSIMELLSDLKG